MEIRGERECQDCGTRWSYYDTGSVTCPDCGSMHSVGVDEQRRLHTTSPVDLDLTESRDLVDVKPLHRVADAAKETCRDYVRKRGFVHGGELRDLDDTYLAAAELMHVADAFGRAFQPSEAEELYFLELLRGADGGERSDGARTSSDRRSGGERPDPVDVPDSMRDARGLATANAVREYGRDLRQWDDAADPAAEDALERLGDHVRRVRALGGDVEPRTADALVAVARAVAAYRRDGDENALATATDRLDRLET